MNVSRYQSSSNGFLDELQNNDKLSTEMIAVIRIMLHDLVPQNVDKICQELVNLDSNALKTIARIIELIYLNSVSKSKDQFTLNQASEIAQQSRYESNHHNNQLSHQQVSSENHIELMTKGSTKSKSVQSSSVTSTITNTIENTVEASKVEEVIKVTEVNKDAKFDDIKLNDVKSSGIVESNENNQPSKDVQLIENKFLLSNVPDQSVEKIVNRAKKTAEKIQSENIKEIVENLNISKMNTDPLINKLVGNILRQASKELSQIDQYIAVLKRLCSLSIKKDSKWMEFNNFLTLRCRGSVLTFKSLKNQLDAIQRLNDEEKKEKRLEGLEKTRQTNFSYNRLYGSMYKNDLLDDNTIEFCMNELIAMSDEESFECLYDLLTKVGKKYEQRVGKGNFEQIDILKKCLYFVDLPTETEILVQQIVEAHNSGNWKLKAIVKEKEQLV